MLFPASELVSDKAGLLLSHDANLLLVVSIVDNTQHCVVAVANWLCMRQNWVMGSMHCQ